MGIFDKLFGGKKDKSSDCYTNQELRLQYNVMKNIALESSQKHKNPDLYQLVENGIYQDLNDNDDAKYRMTISYQLESVDNTNQYPLEDILDKYLMYVSAFLDSEDEQNTNKHVVELGGYLDRMKEAKEIIGKKVFNREFKDEDGQIRVKLIIE